MEENKELETVTESQRNAGKGLFLSGIIVGFAATLLVVGGIFIAFQIHRIVTVKDDVSAQVSYDEGSAVNAQTIKKLQLLEDTVKENFYLSEVTNEQLEDGMYRGLMEALDDPYSEYYTAEELNELTEQTRESIMVSEPMSAWIPIRICRRSEVSSRAHRRRMWTCGPTISSMKWMECPLRARR